MKRFFSTAPFDTDLATLALRLLMGGMFIYHGYPKIGMYNELIKDFDPIGLGSQLSAILVIFGEFVCGIFVLLGFLTRLSVIPMFITMLVVFFVAHGEQAFDEKMLPFVYLCLCVVLFILGSGKYSVDAALFRRKEAVNY